MTIKKIKGTSPTKRFMTIIKRGETVKKPLKSLRVSLPKTAGRDSRGQISVRHKGGRHKRLYREIDFKRNKYGIVGEISTIEYDPNRSASISLVTYSDGEKRYILTPQGTRLGEKIISAEFVEPKIGNSAPLKNIPVGTVVHNIELVPGRGGQLARSAGSYATLMALDGGWAHLKLPSGEVRRVPESALATIGSLSNPDWKNIVFGKAGRKRHLGIRPTVRGVAMNPRDHPHGGGEGRSGIGMSSPKTPWGRPTMGKKTRKRAKLSNRLIVKSKNL